MKLASSPDITVFFFLRNEYKPHRFHQIIFSFSGVLEVAGLGGGGGGWGGGGRESPRQTKMCTVSAACIQTDPTGESNPRSKSTNCAVRSRE